MSNNPKDDTDANERTQAEYKVYIKPQKLTQIKIVRAMLSTAEQEVNKAMQDLRNKGFKQIASREHIRENGEYILTIYYEV
jgi:hypothetical protein